MMDDFECVDELPARPPQSIPAADLELLELAARSIGAARVEVVDGEAWVNLHFADGSTTWNWNPLVHGDDALELAVRLLVGIDHSKFCVHARDDHGNDLALEDVGSSRIGATRRVITCAAAEIGKQRS